VSRGTQKASKDIWHSEDHDVAGRWPATSWVH